MEIADDPNLALVDKLAKTRWLLKHFVRVLERIYYLEPILTIVEMIDRYKGKCCSIRQFQWNKPPRFGIKLFLLASSKSCFVTWVEVFMGKGTGYHRHGFSYSVVWRLLNGLHNRGHVLVVDNWSTLFHDLMTVGTWTTGTIRGIRKDLSAEIKRKRPWAKRGSLCTCIERL